MTSRRSFSLQPKVARGRDSIQVALPDLLFPAGSASLSASQPVDVTWEADLGLSEVIDSISTDRRYVSFVRKTLVTLSPDPDVIAWRQAVLGDFVRNPTLVEQIQALLPRLADLRQGHALLGRRMRGVLLETADRLSELDLYLSVVQELTRALADLDLRSTALRQLREGLQAVMTADGFQALCRELPALQAPLAHLASLTVGINLDSELHPTGALLLSIHDHPFGESAPLLERLLGARTAPDAETGIAPLHRVPDDPDHRPLSPIFQDLERIAQQIAQPIARALERYVKESSSPLTRLEDELAFYVAGARLMHTLEARGCPVCLPEILPAAERLIETDGLLNVALALRPGVDPIASDVRFNGSGRIAILTGPNSGGKTTYLRAIGLAQVLFQAGLFIPASRARMSPVDAILTHFPALETRQQGRLAEEAARLRQIFMQASELSLVLLNESLASTTPAEALYLARDVLAGLRAIGVRAIFATHLIELTSHIDAIEQSVEGSSRVMSLVAGVLTADDGRALPTYIITPGLPQGLGFAQEIARRHGISLPQILAARGKTR